MSSFAPLPKAARGDHAQSARTSRTAILRRHRLLAFFLAVCLCWSQPAKSQAAAGELFDDFAGPAGSPASSELWDYDPGNSGPGDQTYTSSTDNARLDGQGHLLIAANRSNGIYTSGRLVTRGKADMLYGRISARIKMPSGPGIWPAFWLLGSDYHDVGWPQCGEIDLMELVNVGSTYHVTLHGPQGNSDYKGGDGVGTSGAIADLTRDFHVYWMDWRMDSITVGVDHKTLADFTPDSLPAGGQWVFNQPMYAVLNVAVGGDWPGPPTGATEFPATMIVDWFRYTP